MKEMQAQETADSTHVQTRPPQMWNTKIIAVVVLALVIGLGGFFAGVGYQKGKVTTVANASTTGQAGQGAAGAQGGFGGRAGRSMNGSLGTVTAVSSTSISVADQRSSTTKTYDISGDTTVSDNGATAAVTDITVGDTVLVSTGSSTSTAATRIMLNPSFGGQSSDTPAQALTN